MQIKRIHFVGIKGVGMTPLALIAKEAGMSVTGSDTADEFITDPILRDAGIYPLVGFDASHIETPDVVITTGAHGGYDNIEVQTAKSRGIPVLTQGQAVGEFMRGEIFGKSYTGVSVAGSHGKTTTTAMIATILQHAGKDPSYVIGTSDIFPLGKPGHFGLGEYFIAEADEYATEPTHDKTAKFLWQHPLLTVFTNIELDHPDIYPTIESVRSVFLQFAKQLPEDGTLIACGDSEEVETLLKEYTGNVLTYGLSEKNTYTVKKYKNKLPGYFI
jgi:UDP-N-acetylmuramate--alanine ligase